MSILTEEQARAILDKVIKLSKADQCTAQLTGNIDGNIRFALNDISTSGIVDDTDLAVEVAFGNKVGVATINEFDDASLERVVRRAEDLARLAPENPHPAQFHDSRAALDWVLSQGAAHGIDTSRLIAGGDSAGGQMTSVARQRVGPSIITRCGSSSCTRAPTLVSSVR